MTQGPNVKRLIIRKMGADAIAAGGGLTAGIKFLSSRESVMSGARAATQWVEDVIKVVRLAAEPNPWKDASDDQIAAEILRQMESKK